MVFSLTRDKAKAKKGNYLVGYSLKPSWLFVYWLSLVFDMVTLRHLQAEVVVCLHRPPQFTGPWFNYFNIAEGSGINDIRGERNLCTVPFLSCKE